MPGSIGVLLKFSAAGPMEYHSNGIGPHTPPPPPMLDPSKPQLGRREWYREGKATFNQRRILASRDLPVDITQGLASRIVTHVINCKYNPKSYGPKVQQMLSEGRQPGED
jgi:hypothetical protein